MKTKYDRKEDAKAAAALKQKKRIDVYVKKTVESAPPLTTEQRDKVAALLRPYVSVSR